MDQYGCLQVTKEDAENVRLALSQGGSAVFTLSGDSIGAMVVLLCSQFEKIGVMPFGGNPVGRVYVGIYGRGCNHISMGHVHAGYFQEKLNLSAPDADTLSKFWDLLWNVS